ncbi:MAG: DUF3536 domain-containing protein [Candidatus Omnitrophota bacterium]
MNKYICIHGHFYQPPRENPWLNEVEPQMSAYPYHDWNERISAECYARNTASRILDAENKIVDIVINYSKISFNFGPSLLSWMQRKDPKIYEAILDADRISQKNFSGHGSALAQVYSHLIMPLASSRDKRTQVLWGIKDFEYRFKRFPEGMWAAETAIDLETLDLMAEYGIKFTILAPHQAKRFRIINDAKWTTCDGHAIDTHRPYLCRLPSGKTISIFFYHGPISIAVAFEGLLRNGADFAHRIIGSLDHEPKEPQLAHIATDGESYGHHHRFGDMALAYCLHHIESKHLARVTIYGEYLEKFPPTHEVEIYENSSWSCAHGVERWRSDCGCNVGSHPRWNQKWRGPLREALDYLRDQLITLFEKEISSYTKEPWHLRDSYIDVALDRSTENVEQFLLRSTHRGISEDEKIKVLKLLEMQYNAILMYTSCGWFFDDISGIESKQIILYAARALQLAREITGIDLEPDFLKILKKAQSNVPDLKNGALIYENYIRPSQVDLLRVGAHYAVTALYEEYPENTKMYCYTAKSDHYDHREAGRLEMSLGQAMIKSDVTWEKQHIYFVALHFGDHNFICGVEYFKSQEIFTDLKEKIMATFLASNVPETINLISQHFGPHIYSLRHLFKEEQQKVLNKALESTMSEIEASFRQIYEHHYPLMQAKSEIQAILPRALTTVIEFILNRDLCDLLNDDNIDIKRLRNLVKEMKKWPLDKDKANLCYVASRRVNDLMIRFLQNPDDIVLMETVDLVLKNLNQLSLEMDLWLAQNIYFAVGKKFYHDRLTQDNEFTRKWLASFNRLGDILHVRII